MTKVGCQRLREETHDDHFCNACAYYMNKETEYPCNRCLFEPHKPCFWIPAL